MSIYYYGDIVTTPAGLDALPTGCVILTGSHGGAAERTAEGWLLTGTHVIYASADLANVLPATVLHVPVTRKPSRHG